MERDPIRINKSEKGVASPVEQPSKLTSENLANRQERFKKTERQLETACNDEGVEYIPPSPSKSSSSTRARRRKLKKTVSHERPPKLDGSTKTSGKTETPGRDDKTPTKHDR